MDYIIIFLTRKLLYSLEIQHYEYFQHSKWEWEKVLDENQNNPSFKDKLILQFEKRLINYLEKETILKDSSKVFGEQLIFNTHFKMGLYAEQFERLSSLYPRQQIHIECSEDISKSLNYNSVYRFLNIPEINITAKHIQPKGFVGNHSLIMNEKSFHLLSQFYKYYNKLFILWLKAYKDTISDITIDIINHYKSLIRCVENWNELNYTSYLQSFK